MSDDFRDIARDMAILGTAEGTRKSQETLAEIATELKKQNQRAALDRLGPRCPHCGSKLPGRFPKCASCAEDISWVEGTAVVPGQEEVTRQRLRRATLKRKKVRKAKETAQRLIDQEEKTREAATRRAEKESERFGIKWNPFIYLGTSILIALIFWFVSSDVGISVGVFLIASAYFTVAYLIALYDYEPDKSVKRARKSRPISQKAAGQGMKLVQTIPNAIQMFRTGAAAIGMEAKVGTGWQGACLKKQQLLLNGKPVEGTWSEIVREVYTRIYVQVLRRPADSRELTASPNTGKTSKTLIDRINKFLGTTGTPGRSKTALEALITLGELAQSGKIKEAAAQYHQQVWKTPIE